jgi:hypothetical protein
MKHIRRWISRLIFLCVFSSLAPQAPAAAAGAINDTYCRFGISAPKGANSYDLTSLGVGAFLDWRSARPASLPVNINYIHVLNVGDDDIANTLSTLPDQLADHPGAVWIIGNEPDAEVTYQDHITAEVYAQRYHQLAKMIRETDSSARIGFGPVIMPTPIRQHYLELALARLGQLTNNNPHGLIDIFTVHSFLLNEQPLFENGVPVSWGAGVPLGYDPATWPAPETIIIGGENDETWKTHSIDIFRSRITNFRAWMKTKGFQDRPLWITEYGSLFPSVGNIYLTVPEEDTISYMRATFDFLLTAKNDQTGYATDDHRLVQHFVWYSLNDDRWRFGGTLVDPATGSTTLLGDQFISYDPPAGSLPVPPTDVTIVGSSLRIFPTAKSATSDRVDYRVYLRATNLIASEYRTRVKVEFLENGKVIAESQEGMLPRCGGQGIFSFVVKGLTPGETHNFSARVTLISENATESNPSNDLVNFPPTKLDPIFQKFFPVMHHVP